MILACFYASSNPPFSLEIRAIAVPQCFPTMIIDCWGRQYLTEGPFEAKSQIPLNYLQPLFRTQEQNSPIAVTHV